MPYFYTMCGIILDVICGLNYNPFTDKVDRLNELVAKLKSIASSSGMVAHIGGGTNEEKTEKLKSVKFCYLAWKGGQGKQAKLYRDKANTILAEYAGSSVAELVVTDPFDELYAERGH